MEDEVLNSFFDFLSSVSHRDFDDLVTNARVTQLEEAFRLEGVFPEIRQSLYGGQQRIFLAAVVKFIDEDEKACIPTRNGMTWNTNGFSSVYLDYLDRMDEKGLINYDREARTIAPLPRLRTLSKLNVPSIVVL
jgi:hypothetical protein